MNNWGRLAVFDLETTGVDVDTARIVSACIAVLGDDGTIVERWDWLADPGIEIPDGAAAVHGINTERARALGRPAPDVVAEIAQSLRVLFGLGIPLVVYNAPYDLTLLDRECRRHQLTPLVTMSPVIDPLVMDKAVDRFRKGKRTLEVTAELYGVTLDGAHDAGADAIAAGRVAQALVNRYPDEFDVPLAQLHDRQQTWYAEQAASFADYIRRVKGDDGYVADTAWPIRPLEFPTSVVDTQPIPTPEPRPSLTVPHLDFDTGRLELDVAALRPAIEAPALFEPDLLEQPPVIETDSFVDLPLRKSEPVVEPSADSDPAAPPVSTAPPAYASMPAPSMPPAYPGAPVPFDSRGPRVPAQGYRVEPVISIETELPEETDLPAESEEPADAIAGREAPVDALVEPEPEREPEPAPELVLEPGSEPEPEGEADLPEPQQSAPTSPASLRPTVLRVAAAIVNDPTGRTLLVRKKGTTSFMQAGGKIERGESALDALTRELREELGLELDPDVTEYLGSFRAEAANEPDTIIRAEVFALTTALDFQPSGEIDELVWIDSDEPEGIQLAPLTRDTLLPLWVSRRSALF